QRRIGRFYWDGSKIIKDSVRTEFSSLITDLLYYIDPQICNGRLSLSTGVPVPSSDISSSSIVYFTPYFGNRVALYVQDYGWRIYSFSELTLDISGIADGKSIDVWLYDNAGTLTLAYTEWSNDTLRATAIVRQDGVLVKSGSPSYRYLGSVHLSAAGETCDSVLKRLVWNNYHRVKRQLLKMAPTSGWTYTAETVRPLNNDSTERFEVMVGVDEDPIFAMLYQTTKTSSSGGWQTVGFGIDTTTEFDSDCLTNNLDATHDQHNHAFYIGHVGIGYHKIQFLENARSGYTCTFSKSGYAFATNIKNNGSFGWIYS
ncbi:MAG: hypothetical protein J7K66_02205, partial [Anaerolineaceae bacterium]|nr:hypothetical protein [Anaerolineaceae bacterium]